MEDRPRHGAPARRSSVFLRVFRIGSNSFAFGAGILVSISTNLYTSVLLDRSRPGRPTLYAAAALFGVASLALLATSVTVDELRTRAGGFLDAQVRTHRRRLAGLGGVALIAFVGGCVLVFLGTRP
jgi:hypothetical protein